MTRRDVRSRSRTLLVALVALLLPVTTGCTTVRWRTNSPYTAIQQLLETEAMDRALAELSWPRLEGKSVFVQVASPADAGDQVYLRHAVAAALAEQGSRIVEDSGSADYIVSLLAGSVGTEQVERFVGLPPIQSVLIPIALPELALYKSARQDGFAKIEAVLTDPQQGGLIGRVGPVQGRTYVSERRILFLTFRDTDTSMAQ